MWLSFFSTNVVNMPQCSCLTVKGTQCKLFAIQGSKYCQKHKFCKKIRSDMQLANTLEGVVESTIDNVTSLAQLVQDLKHKLDDYSRRLEDIEQLTYEESLVMGSLADKVQKVIYR